VIYLDSSALGKFLIDEIHSSSFRASVDGRTDLVSSGLARVEVTRIGRLHGGAAVERARQALARLGLLPVDALLQEAAALAGPRLKSLDAIHVAGAQALGDELEALITYDRQMQDAARGFGLPVSAPGQGSR